MSSLCLSHNTPLNSRTGAEEIGTADEQSLRKHVCFSGSQIQFEGQYPSAKLKRKLYKSMRLNILLCFFFFFTMIYCINFEYKLVPERTSLFFKKGG